jgi:hypothetical protein
MENVREECFSEMQDGKSRHCHLRPHETRAHAIRRSSLDRRALARGDGLCD